MNARNNKSQFMKIHTHHAIVSIIRRVIITQNIYYNRESRSNLAVVV